MSATINTTTPLLPAHIHAQLKSAAHQAQSTLKTMYDWKGPAGVSDRLENYGLKVDYGNCTVNIQIEIPKP